jgi:hypothetical protein
VIARNGGVHLQELTTAHLNRLYGELLVDGRRDGTGGLPTSVRRIHSMLHKALNDAVRWGLLERSVALIADPPPMRAVRAARRRSMRTWTERELHIVLASTEDHELHPMWVVAAFAGLRRSEVLGLRWSDVDSMPRCWPSARPCSQAPAATSSSRTRRARSRRARSIWIATAWPSFGGNDKTSATRRPKREESRINVTQVGGRRIPLAGLQGRRRNLVQVYADWVLETRCGLAPRYDRCAQCEWH